MVPGFWYSSWTRLAFIECGWPLSTMTVHGNPFSVAQSGMHVPVLGWTESPLPDLPHWTTRVRTGVTIGICSVNGFGTWLGSGSVALRVTVGSSTLNSSHLVISY